MTEARTTARWVHPAVYLLGLVALGRSTDEVTPR